MTRPRIAVVGAGIGGLATASALTRAGFDCVVFERADGPPRTGGGIQVPPNAVRALHEIGLGDAWEPVAAVPSARVLRRWADGCELGRTPLGTVVRQRYGLPYWAMRRADLWRELRDAVPNIHFGRECAAVLRSAGAIELIFADGSRYAADFAIGADGLRSTVRRALTGATNPARFSGHTVHRATVAPAVASSLASVVTVWLGPGQHAVCYPVGRDGTLNLVATTPGRRPGNPLAAYAGWDPVLRSLLAATSPAAHGLYHHPLPYWGTGRVALVGDAAHAMLPFLAQGAALAIEDGVVLADLLRRTGSFAGYADVRRSRVERVATLVNAGDHDYHLPDGVAQRKRDARLRNGGPAFLDWLYGWSPADRRPVVYP